MFPCRRIPTPTCIWARPFSVSRHAADEASFQTWSDELNRRKRKADYKRRQHGQSFLDHVVVSVRGGTGGSGAAAFVPMKSSSQGPPSGGNGGAGGDIYLVTSPHVTSLASVSKRIRAGNGLNGQGSYRHGKRGTDTIVRVPVGTVVREIGRETEADKAHRDEAALGDIDDAERRRMRRARMFIKHPTGEITDDDYAHAERLLARESRAAAAADAAHERIEMDIARPLERPVLIARGGTGGLGNPHFIDPAQPHRAPRLASRGATPPTLTLALELKLIADVGLVGFPNAGKSTVLRALTGRRAEVADYSFTTLNPQVGVVRVMDDGTWRSDVKPGKDVIDETWREREREQQHREHAALPKREDTAVERIRFTMSDNPGLLPLASENYGLGHSFLRSIERSLALVYVLDMTRPSPASDLAALEHELEMYKPGLAQKAMMVVLNKADEVDEPTGRERLRELEDRAGRMQLITVSAKYGLGMSKVVAGLARYIERARVELDEADE
ncbi:GTPase of the mitochondrial inner membrane that associates with the large ribosomal subunit [Naganishia albida]|nr:GTPase of the mitochondrial inner membrane that associates with the large ribosomal subunit [Naganishia albida]